MQYDQTAIDDREVPRAAVPLVQHTLDIYASEINKVASVWRTFRPGDLEFRPHPRSMTVLEVFRHELLSARRFFGGFLGAPEPSAEAILPNEATVDAYVKRLGELARPRLQFLAAKDEAWWLERAPFFDAERPRIWIFWRRVLHTAHHRTQLTVYLRLLNLPVPPVYGPTADVTWDAASPTLTVDPAPKT
jgi:uncharacterized damage-inducible protein DinB